MRRGGGLYGNFVSSNDTLNRPYRGAEIPPPTNLTSTLRRPAFPPPNAGGGGGGGIPPPASYRPQVQPGLSKHGYSTMTSISANAMSYANYGQEIKRPRTEDEYFNEEEEGADPNALPYQPAPGSPGPGNKEENSDSEEDPLDAFMANLEKDAKKSGVKSAKEEIAGSKGVVASKGASSQRDIKGVRADIEEADDEESYYKWLEENPNAGRALDEDEEGIEYDEDGNPIVPNKPKYIDPLPPIDHSQITYKPFEKNFYVEHADIQGLSPIQTIDLRHKLDIHVSGALPPHPVSSFGHFGFDDKLLKGIRKSDFTQPTPIQAQGIPALMSGRDVIGIAKTGSGKTAAFLWPMLVHIMDQPRLRKGDGPIGLVLVPTRELAMQIYAEAKKFGKVYDLQVVCAYGGGSKWEQSKAFEAGAEIAIATPGRMIDMIKMKVTNLERVTYLVLDEADRMFDMGFEPQVRSICDHVRPDRQCSLFSATFKKRIERLARDSLNDPIKIVQGDIGQASEDVTQIVKVLGLGGFKWNWLLTHLVEFTSAGSVLIFVTKKQNCEELANNLKLKEFELRCIHGDMHQHERNEIISQFKKQEFPILVATDVAARGLDIPHIRTVVNFDVARDIDTHTHRIGRTGRAGVKGNAYTLVTEKDKEFVGHIVRNLEAANQEVPKDLMDLALKSSWFKNARFKRGGGKNRGLGFKERPGFGSGSSSSGGSSHAYGDSSVSNLGQTGPAGGGRLAAVRQAFKSQFMSQFRAAEGGMPPPPPQQSDPPPQPPVEEEHRSERKRKSRWE